jgi:hypothetical protein
MKKWEDIIKDRLEGYESTLPEGSLADFRALRDAGKTPHRKKGYPWIWAVSVAAAAGLAAVLFLRHPEMPATDIRIIEEPLAPVAWTDDLSAEAERMDLSRMVAQAVMPKAVAPQPAKETAVSMPAAEGKEGKEENEGKEPETKEDIQPSAVEEASTDAPVVTIESPSVSGSPYLPENKSSRPVIGVVLPAVGAVAGGGLLAALVPSFLGARAEMAPGIRNEPDPVAAEPGQHQMVDAPTGGYTCHFPFKGGLSVGIPVAERLKITTGLEYSVYRSDVTYSLSGEKRQYAHYLGVPVRLDWTLASIKWLDVYVGGGFAGDYCVGATLAGERIRKDGFSFSLQGAGGVQFKVSRHFGIYVEPELSWTLPAQSRVLETYRSQHPFMFSVSTGVRINLENK